MGSPRKWGSAPAWASSDSVRSSNPLDALGRDFTTERRNRYALVASESLDASPLASASPRRESDAPADEHMQCTLSCHMPGTLVAQLAQIEVGQ
jgi:hypothetical protein